jgi:phosphatidylserine decarboxylase
MRLAPEGIPTIAICMALGIVLALLGYFWRGGPHCYLTAGVTVVTLFMLYFFRDPERSRTYAEGQVASPADGTVIAVREVDEPHLLKGRAVQVSIFMSVFSVHVNRIPAAGTVAYKKYFPGKFLVASADKASTDNEQTHLGIETPRGKVLMKQIAGLLARRVVCYPEVGQAVATGQRMGLIKFGSRVDLLLPQGSAVAVKAGDHVRAGLDIVATLPANQGR